MVLFSLILPDEDLLKISILISVAGLRIVDSILPDIKYYKNMKI